MEINTIKSDAGMKWEMVRLGDVCDIKNGRDHKKVNNPNGLYPIIGSGGVMGFANDFLCEGNATIIGRKGSINNPIFIDSKFWNVDTAFALCTQKDLDSKFLYYFCRTYNFEKHNKATTLPSLTKTDLLEIQIPLPPLPIQKRIAQILDAADALKRKDQQLLQKYDELAQAIFIDMFGDPVKNEKGWVKVKLCELMSIVRGGSPRPIDKFLGGTYPWIKIGDATKGDDVYLNSTKEHIIKEGLTKTRLLPAGSLIFANCGVSLGFARIITFEGCIHDGWLAFSDFDDKRINKFFLLKALNSITEYFRNSAPEGTQPNLNTGIIKDFELILPPLALQEKFENISESFKLSKNKVEQSCDFTNSFFNSLIHKAFKGELVA